MHWIAERVQVDVLRRTGREVGSVLVEPRSEAARARQRADEVIDHAKRLHVSIHAVVEGPGSLFLARSTQALDPAELIGQLTTATDGLRLLDRPADPRQRNPGPLVAQIMDVLHAQK